MKKLIFAVTFLISFATHAEDRIMVKVLNSNSDLNSNSAIVNFMNPDGDMGVALILCISDDNAAEAYLSVKYDNTNNSQIKNDNGGIILVPGSSIIVKSNVNATSNILNVTRDPLVKFIKIECK